MYNKFNRTKHRKHKTKHRKHKTKDKTKDKTYKKKSLRRHKGGVLGLQSTLSPNKSGYSKDIEPISPDKMNISIDIDPTPQDLTDLYGNIQLYSATDIVEYWSTILNWKSGQHTCKHVTSLADNPSSYYKYYLRFGKDNIPNAMLTYTENPDAAKIHILCSAGISGENAGIKLLAYFIVYKLLIEKKDQVEIEAVNEKLYKLYYNNATQEIPKKYNIHADQEYIYDDGDHYYFVDWTKPNN